MTEASSDERAQRLWRDLVEKERQFFDARVSLLQAGVDVEALIDRALTDPDQVGAALRQLMFLQEPRLRQFLPALLDVVLRDERYAQLVRPLIRSLDGKWLTGQLARVVELFLGRERPATEVEADRTAAFLYALDPRLHAVFEERRAGGEEPAAADAGLGAEPNAVLRLAMASLRQAPSGVAQHAIDAALGWSALYVPTSAGGEGDAILHNRETGAKTIVAFTREQESPEWGGYRDLVWRRDPAIRVVWRGLAVDCEGILLDPEEGNAGVLLPRAGLRAVVGERPRQEIREGDNLALRLAVDGLRTDPTPLARAALREALANGGALVPAVGSAAGGIEPPYVFRSPAGEGDGALYAFSDREALGSGPPWAREAAVVLPGPALVDALAGQDRPALALNAGESGPVVIPRSEVGELAGQA